MAKKTHGYSLRGIYNHEKGVIAEYDKKTKATSYYSVKDILNNFHGKEITLTVSEHSSVPTVKNPFENEG